ncbi:hypothetical protein BC827DRAFT_1155781 [Russula dissimulans]|nr:hypothetical protein BC827DRAFT_1155781 [Russula dissimulans]
MDAVNCLPKGREKGVLRLGKYRCNRVFSDKVFRRVVILWGLPNPRRHLHRLLVTIWHLNSHPTGNLTPFFHYALTREGPDDKVIHTARVMFRGTCYGEGRGRRIGLAKSQAARQALEYFEENDVPEA